MTTQLIYPSPRIPDAAMPLLNEWAREDVRDATMAGPWPVVHFPTYNNI